MPRLWIANTTKQVHEFLYRPRIGGGGKAEDGLLKPIFGEIRKQTIPVGGQICVSGVDSDGDIRNVLDQHKNMVKFEDLNKVRGFQGFCYRIGPDPVPIGEILERIETNDKALTERSKERQKQTSLEIASTMRATSQSDDAPFKDLRETDVQIAQRGDKEVNGGTPKLNQVFEITEAGKEASGRGRKSAA